MNCPKCDGTEPFDNTLRVCETCGSYWISGRSKSEMWDAIYNYCQFTLKPSKLKDRKFTMYFENPSNFHS